MNTLAIGVICTIIGILIGHFSVKRRASHILEEWENEKEERTDWEKCHGKAEYRNNINRYDERELGPRFCVHDIVFYSDKESVSEYEIIGVKEDDEWGGYKYQVKPVCGPNRIGDDFVSGGHLFSTEEEAIEEQIPFRNRKMVKQGYKLVKDE